MTIPADCIHAHLALYLHVDTSETQAVAYDTLTTAVLDSSGIAHPLATWSNTDAAPGFTLRTSTCRRTPGRPSRCASPGRRTRSRR
ncbi:hypothetical protein AB4Z54_51575, partial [Streptomyces sp. MCAF7]